METTNSSNQTSPPPPEGSGNKRSFIERHSASIKLVVIGFLTLLLLIPLGMIRGLINERKFTKTSAVQEITSKWSGEQVITGPCIAIPYTQERMVNDKREIVTKDILLFPEALDIQGDAAVEKRKRGIYDASVYKAEITLTGAFDRGEIEKAGIKKEDIRFDKARVIMGVTDLKGIRETVSLQLNGKSFAMEPGIPVENLFTGPNPALNEYLPETEKSVAAPNVSTGIFAAGLNVRPDSLPGDTMRNEKIPFSVTLYLNGSMGLYVVPVGKVTTVSFQSDWTTPSFGGDFLPASHEITKEGFSANWKVLDLNRSYGQVVRAEDSSAINLVASSLFGVKFIQSVDQYQQNLRSVKYAVLIILLTFVVVLFIELIKKNPVNPFHYLLVGLALVLFYALLLSMSEIWGFNLAYAVAALMTIIMITLHMGAILRNRKQGVLVGSLLAFLYVFVFLLIRMESYSLLAGSLGLFAILAVIMYYARKIRL
ncbi:cell envelope integrity protein CreD [uncultured Proteiniphilum sp.]|uniref:cell envelope integrity protein CreD n=1 Tax=uncultured Proteiniphilum sp. TaxID=497637 RepID=UPI00262A2FF8|nr:cell envelope integrity protein CreD [uncultured Proteiniphilum sp.]